MSAKAETTNAQSAQNTQNTQKIVKLGLILFTITAITGLILGVVYEITAGPIALTQQRLKNEALSAALPEADAFEAQPLGDGAPAIVTDVQKASSNGAFAGYCVTVTPKGYAGPIEIVVGVTAEGKLRAIRILSQGETPGLGAKAATDAFMGQYTNKEVESLTVVKSPPSSPEQIQAISGATITSDAVTSGVNIALEYWKNNLRGGN